MATKKIPPQPPTKKRRTSTKEPLSMEPAETVAMTDEQCRETIQVLVPLVDSYVARHRDDPPPDSLGELPSPAERHDLLAQAVAVWRTRPEPRLRYREETKAVDAQIRHNNQAVTRYLRAFESGTMPEELCSGWVQELKDATLALRARKKELAAHLKNAADHDDAHCLEGVSLPAFLQEVFDAEANRPLVKALLRLLVEEIRVDGPRVRPIYRLPPGVTLAASPTMAAGGEDQPPPSQIADSIWGRTGWAMRPRPPAATVAARSSEALDPVDLAAAVEFARNRPWSVLTTIRRDGRPQLSNVGHVVDADGTIRVSVAAARAKYHNLRRDPSAALHVTGDDFYAYVVLEGDVELSPAAKRPDDAVVDELVEHHQALTGERPSWDDYRAAMVAERRTVLRLTAHRAYGMLGSLPSTSW